MSRRSRPIFSTNSVRSAASSGSIAVARERQIERPRAEEAHEEGEHGIGAPTRTILGGEARMLADVEREVERFREQGVVRFQAVRARRDLARDDVAVIEDGEVLAIQQHDDLAVSDVLL